MDAPAVGASFADPREGFLEIRQVARGDGGAGIDLASVTGGQQVKVRVKEMSSLILMDGF